MSHREEEGGVGLAVQGPEAQEGGKEQEFNLHSPHLFALSLKTQTELTNIRKRT